MTLTISGYASQQYYDDDNGHTPSGNKKVYFTLVYEISGNTITLKSGNTSGQSATGVPSGNMKPWATEYNITSVTLFLG